MVGGSLQTDLHHQAVPGHTVLNVIGFRGRDFLHGRFVQGDGETDKVPNRQIIICQGGTGAGVHGLQDDFTGFGRAGGGRLQGWAAGICGAGAQQSGQSQADESSTFHGVTRIRCGMGAFLGKRKIVARPVQVPKIC
jgi:hypothetical protein